MTQYKTSNVKVSKLKLNKLNLGTKKWYLSNFRTFIKYCWQF